MVYSDNRRNPTTRVIIDSMNPMELYRRASVSFNIDVIRNLIFTHGPPYGRNPFVVYEFLEQLEVSNIERLPESLRGIQY